MTDYSKVTKAELIETNARLQARITTLNEVSAAQPPRPVRVPEAESLAACIRALDSLKEDSQRSYGNQQFGGSNAFERVLRSLASKYGVNLVEVRTEPCARAHVDEIDMQQVRDVIQHSRRPEPGIDIFGKF